MSYLTALVLVSTAFAAWERLMPGRPQAALRPGFLRDIAYLLINGHVAGVLIALLLSRGARAGLGVDLEFARFGENWHPAAQLAIHLVLFDFFQWCVHNLLHRVDFVWRFHQIHHQIQTMDWIGNFHFHPLEVVVYRTILWLPSAFFLFDPQVLFVSAIIGTAWGHFNHANLRVHLGPLAYLVNGPEMHLWHHAHLDETRGRPVNFAIIFTAWDWLFGTAYFPAVPPRRLGFPSVESFPEDLPGQLIEPVRPRAIRDAGVRTA